MMKVITGSQFNTHNGIMVVPDNQNAVLKRGDMIQFNDKEYTVIEVISPSKPDGKWSIRVA